MLSWGTNTFSDPKRFFLNTLYILKPALDGTPHNALIINVLLIFLCQSMIDVTLCNLVLTEIAKYASSKLMKDIDIISLGRDIGDTISDEVERKWGITLTDVTMTDISPCRVISLTDRKD